MASLYFTRASEDAEFGDEALRRGVKLREIYRSEKKSDSLRVHWSAQDARLYWVSDFWCDCQRIEFTSISDAAKKLRALARRWAYTGGAFHRRGQLIAEALKIKFTKTLPFSPQVDIPPCHAFTLENDHTLLYATRPLKGQFAPGKIAFVEDRSGPPSRAYLKLWELCTLAGFTLTAEDTVLDLGATPGGWSYVAASMGAAVTMVDRSAPESTLLKKFPRLQFVKGDGLAAPRTLGSNATVLLSDMACEPYKLYAAIQEWITMPQLRAMVCTLKFHGLSDKALLERFASLPNSTIYHLWHNGHELTWFWRR